MGVMIGPIMGPTLGGYLTAWYDWRFVFYINLPFGAMAALGFIMFLPDVPGSRALRFDWMGFSMLSIGIGALQMMLDRGQERDWFSSREVILEAILAALGCYLFFVHLGWARRPLIRPILFRDINFSAGLAMMFLVGTLLVSSLAMMAPWLQTLANYPVDTAGLLMAPRGIGNLITIVLSGRLAHRIDARLMVGTGMAIEFWSFWIMTSWTPDVSQQAMIAAVILQGAGIGLVFTPLQLLAFATLDPALRTEGASLFSLARNIGAAMGVSVVTTMMARNTQVLHETIGAALTPFNRMMESFRMLNPVHPHGAAVLDQIVNQQASIIAYIDDYKLMAFVAFPSLVLLLLMRPPRLAERVEAEPVE